MGLHVIVLAGGSGTRLWPLSRAAVPKHLLPLGPGGATLLRTTVERVLPLGAEVHVVTHAGQADACRRELAGLLDGPDAVIAEPEARGTGPALGLAVRWIARSDPDAVICSVHADHHIGDPAAYRAALWSAAGWAAATDGLVAIGLVPAFASTGLGYAALGERREAAAWTPPPQASPPLEDVDAAAAALPAYVGAGFAEKPAAEVAQRYVDAGTHLWNLGLFAWTAAAFEREMRAASPEADAGLAAVVEARGAGDEDRAARLYGAVRATPVEPLVLERTAALTVVQVDFPWSDLGSWADLLEAWQATEADADGNVVRGEGMVAGSRGCLVDSLAGRMVAVVGCENVVAVDTGDAVLVVPRDRVQGVRDVVERLRASGREDLL